MRQPASRQASNRRVVPRAAALRCVAVCAQPSTRLTLCRATTSSDGRRRTDIERKCHRAKCVLQGNAVACVTTNLPCRTPESKVFYRLDLDLSIEEAFKVHQFRDHVSCR